MTAFRAIVKKAACRDVTQLEPSVANVPATCMLIFKLTSVTNTAHRLKLCLELEGQDDIEY
jgi:hypothetical protein